VKAIRLLFVAVFLFAAYSIAACVLTHTNPLTAIATAIFAGASVVLVDYLEAEHNKRIIAERRKQWARRDGEWL
jgi:hypothetical protein